MSNPSSDRSGSLPAADIFPSPSSDKLVAARAQLLAERERVAALSLFARRVSHDMSNFITVVRTYSELLLADLAPASATHGDVLEIQRTADAMIEYMGRIARFARAGGARVSTVALDDIVRDVMTALSLSDGSFGDLTAACSIRIDATWLSDALREVILNAREAAPAGSSVSVATRQLWLPVAIIDDGVPIDAGAWAIVEVTDSGPGFPGESPRQSIDPFITTKSGIRGAGFGLALARSVLWHAGGQLVVGAQSGPDEGGAAVRLWLPVEPLREQDSAHL